ncbi:protein CIP2A [Orussus abietinus]|uniref:protein CIP2A n=1 Tax=Orussus abietinus TaxID=222816 RepID=UPI0006266294|nr:protein CIP2A [Orussus abietinus]XP_012273597.1 protein CIP2A [Orussus abietinus]XP_023288526.1 protein CIP2A [Orussus abietinus]
MEKYQHMRKFISATLEYTKHADETTAAELERNLVVISTLPDLSLFHPGSCIVAEFYVSLYKLINSLDSRTTLIWSAISAVQNACRNDAARRALIYTYNFAPILGRLLKANLISEKRIRVLKLLQELTYGIKISWQEAHLPDLISTLTQWITQSSEEDVIALSLGVLVNLCYKNLPAVYTLMRKIDMNEFVKSLLKMQSCSVSTRVHCCKLLLILEYNNREISEKKMMDFIAVTFLSLKEALNNKDALLLRHIVDFFEDARQNHHAALLMYPNYATEVENVLDTVNSQSDHKCVSLVMEFLSLLVKLQISALLPLYSACIETAMIWIPIEQVCSKALVLIRTIVIDTRRTKSSAEVFSKLDLSTLMHCVNFEGDDEMQGMGEKRSTETHARLTELMQLLQEMVKLPDLKNKVMQAFTEQTMRDLLIPILEREEIRAEEDWPRNLFHDPSTTLYVHALALTADLAPHNSNWLTLYSELLQCKQMQMVMAVALLNGDIEVKQKILLLPLSVGFPQECTSGVARCMRELETLMLMPAESGIFDGNKSRTTSNVAEMVPLFSLTQEGRLDNFIARLGEVFERNQASDVTISMVMELYEYKLAVMKDAERATQASLEAANNHSTSMQHRLAQVLAESSRLHQLLFYTQQCLEGMQAEKKASTTRLQKAEVESKKIHATQIQEIKSLKKIITEKSETIDETMKELEECRVTIASLEKVVEESRKERSVVETKLQQLTAKEQDLSQLLHKTEGALARKNQEIESLEKKIASFNENVSALRQEIDQLTKQGNTYQKVIAEKEESIKKLQNELTDLNRIRNIIFELTAKQKDESNAS